MRYLTLITTLLCSSIASAQPVAEEHWNEDAKLTLAQVMVAEASFVEQDHIAIAWVLQKRWETYRELRDSTVSFADFARRYSAMFKVATPRTRAIRALPWGPADGHWGGPRWDRVRELVEAWGRGEVPDTVCPGARHWGGKMDKAPTSRRYGWRVARCSQRTANIFWEPTFAKR